MQVAPALITVIGSAKASQGGSARLASGGMGGTGAERRRQVMRQVMRQLPCWPARLSPPLPASSPWHLPLLLAAPPPAAAC